MAATLYNSNENITT